jgi:hypothetical protein
MKTSLRLFRPRASAAHTSGALDAFVDGLVQKFENCRAGLADGTLAGGGAESFFVPLYEAERDRLAEAIRLEQAHLDPPAREAMFAATDRLVRTVVTPAYARLAARFTARERNGFFVVAEPLHPVERASCAVAGVVLGAFVVWAPFIPLWSKEWVLPFFLGGLVFPELRRWWEIRRYERELNRLVARADAEIGRMDLAFLLRERTDASGPPVPVSPQGGERARTDERAPA